MLARPSLKSYDRAPQSTKSLFTDHEQLRLFSVANDRAGCGFSYLTHRFRRLEGFRKKTSSRKPWDGRLFVLRRMRKYVFILQLTSHL